MAEDGDFSDLGGGDFVLHFAGDVGEAEDAGKDDAGGECNSSGGALMRDAKEEIGWPVDVQSLARLPGIIARVLEMRQAI